MRTIKKVVKSGFGQLFINFAVYIYNLRERNPIYNYIYELFLIVLRNVNMTLLQVVDSSKYSEITNSNSVQIIEVDRVGVMSDNIYAGDDINTTLNSFTIPDLLQFCFNDVCLRGNSDIIVDKERGLVICDAAYNLNNNEDVVDGLLYRTRGNICLLRDNLQHNMQAFKSGIMISGKFSHNYYHLIYETLIKLIYLPQTSIPDDVPIFLDKSVLTIPSCKRIYNILTDQIRRDVVLLDDTSLYSVGKLYSFSRVNILPAHVININKPIKILYSQTALERMREVLLKYKSNTTFPDRIFISRTNGKVRHYNEDEVFQVLKRYNFKKVIPESLSFEDQMSLFNGAQYIVSGSGAALSNLLFSNSCCTVVCFGLGSSDNHCDLPIFNTIANINKTKFIFFPRKKCVKGNIHVNYEIDCVELQRKMDQIVFKM